MNESQRTELFAIRKALDSLVVKMVDNPSEINENVVVIRKWEPGVFEIDDVRKYNDIPYKCIQAHDCTNNMAWTPDTVASLWIQYHGTSNETARAWITPTGAHDIYKAGEWMIWTDGNTYECIVDTNFDPASYPAAWAKS